MKKFLSLMMLLLIVGGGKLWAQTTIFSISDVSVTENVSVASKQAHTVTSSEATIVGGTVELYNGKGSAADMLNTSKQITIAGSGASYIHVSLTGNTIAEGDVIAFGEKKGTGYIAKTSTKPNSTITIGEGGYEVPEGSELIGQTEIYFWKPSKDEVKAFTEMTITRTNIDTESPTCTTTQTSKTAEVGTALNLEVTVEHFTSMQWYKAESSDLSDAAAIEGATTAIYAYDAIKADDGKTYYFYCVATNSFATGEKTAQSSTITVNVNYTKSTACKLYEAKYSNGFNAFITEPSGDNNGTVKVFYLEGTDAPTISSTDISDYATANTTNASQIVITAEDGTKTATYDVTIEAVTPYNGTEIQFDGNESWIKSGGKYTEISGDKTYYAWVINRQLKDSENRDTDVRVAAGRTRIYFFVDKAEGVTLINDRGTSLSFDRSIKVYVNGELQDTPSSMPKYNADTPASITITTGAPAMIEISSDQNGGDTGWGKMTVTPKAAATETVKVTVTSAGYATFSSDKNLDFTNAEKIKAYTAKFTSDSEVEFTRIYQVPAGAGVLLWAAGGATEDIPVIAEASDVSNDFKVAQTDMGRSDLNEGGQAYVLGNHNDYGIGFYQPGEDFTLPAGKCYLQVSEGNARIFLPGMEATGIGTTLVKNEGVKNEIFNLNGQRINKLQKGLNIVNGRKVVVK